MRLAAVAPVLLATSSFAHDIPHCAAEERAIELATVYDIVTEVVWVTQVSLAPTSAIQTACSVAAPRTMPTGPTKPIVLPTQVSSTKNPPTATSTPPKPSTSSPDPVSVVISTATAPTPTIGALEEACVTAHNQLRSRHQAGPLVWDADLAASAQALAETCVFGHDVELGPAVSYGQNIAASWGTLGMHDTTTEATSVIKDSWYSAESEAFAKLGLYGIANPILVSFDAWGHFTQEVWIATTRVGCAVATCETNSDSKYISNGYYTVCNYQEPGNYAGQFAQNVLQ